LNQKRIILLVEDEAIIALTLAQSIRNFGYEVVTANSGEKAVKISIESDRINFVLMDLDLGSGMHGPEAAREILKKRNIPIVFLTAHSGQMMVESVTGIPHYGYIMKSSGDFLLKSSIEMAFQLFDALEKVKASEAKFKSIIELAPDAILLGNSVGIIIGANERASEISGYSYDELIGESIQILFKEEEQKRVPLRYDLLKKGLVVRNDRILTRKDGMEVFIGMNTKMMPDGTYQTFIRDMTERKIAEDKLAAEKERLAVTLGSIGDGVITTDTHGNIVIMNKIAEELTGWNLNAAWGRPLSEVFNIIDEVTRLQCENPAEKVLVTGQITEIENNTILISQDGIERIISDSGAPITDNNNVISGVVIVFRDMTEKRKLLDAVQQTDRLNSLGVLAGGIAHDFNNLLSGIFGYIEMARLKSSSDKTVMEYLDKAFTVFDRARGLTQQLLTFSKGGLPLRKTGDISLLIKDSAAFALSGSNISCKFESDENLRLCDFDENQIAQVIDNVIINAKQAMPLGGNISVIVKNSFLDKHDIPILRSGDYIKISISDTGIGIQQEHLKRIFDPFFTTKQQGNGLGLATCYSIIKKHDGFIEAKSAPGKGTEFVIYLPVSEKTGENNLYSDTNQHTGTGKILIMDDEDFIRDISIGLLKLLGYDAVEAADGVEALKILAAANDKGEPFDGAVLDLTIPGGMGGRETLAEIRKVYPDLPVFASSGFSEDPVIAKPQDYGFTGSIRKPYRKDELAEMLGKYLMKK